MNLTGKKLIYPGMLIIYTKGSQCSVISQKRETSLFIFNRKSLNATIDLWLSCSKFVTQSFGVLMQRWSHWGHLAVGMSELAALGR